MFIVISLFDGISCGQIAFERAGINIITYYASEIKKIAIETTKKHYPDTVHIGDVAKVKYVDDTLYTEKEKFKIDNKNIILIGGSPCQDFTLIKASGRGLKGDKSKLFYEFLRLLNEINPVYFLLENVKMKKENEKQLNEYLKVDGVHINSNLVSYQNRPRVYWTNIKFNMPKDKKINFQDYKETDYFDCLPYKLKPTLSRFRMWANGNGRNRIKAGCANITYSNKILCITRNQDRCPNSGLIMFDGFCRTLTQKELEQGQTLPIGYTGGLSYRQAQDVIGDCWTVDVIAHVLKGIKR